MYIPAPSKGCQLNPKGWLIDTLKRNHLAPKLEGPGIYIYIDIYISLQLRNGSQSPSSLQFGWQLFAYSSLLRLDRLDDYSTGAASWATSQLHAGVGLMLDWCCCSDLRKVKKKIWRWANFLMMMCPFPLISGNIVVWSSSVKMLRLRIATLLPGGVGSQGQGKPGREMKSMVNGQVSDFLKGTCFVPEIEASFIMAWSFAWHFFLLKHNFCDPKSDYCRSCFACPGHKGPSGRMGDGFHVVLMKAAVFSCFISVKHSKTWNPKHPL